MGDWITHFFVFLPFLVIFLIFFLIGSYFVDLDHTIRFNGKRIWFEECDLFKQSCTNESFEGLWLHQWAIPFVLATISGGLILGYLLHLAIDSVTNMHVYPFLLGGVLWQKRKQKKKPLRKNLAPLLIANELETIGSKTFTKQNTFTVKSMRTGHGRPISSVQRHTELMENL